MDPGKQREIARRGGKLAHAKGRAHEFTPEEARAAGRKGGEAKRRATSRVAREPALGSVMDDLVCGMWRKSAQSGLHGRNRK